jgi:Zn-dependent peptidase ImmA (M78 family)
MPDADLIDALKSGVDITDDSEVRQLARKLGVSVQALAIRIDGLGWNVDGKMAF